ncbi:hypothetical protein D3C71_346880 [compost metagenome]|jgi:hypothetical protein
MNFAGVTLVLALQTTSLADLQAEAERHGRLTAAVGYCTLIGYSSDDRAMSAYVEKFHARAAAGGMNREDIQKLVSAGAAKEIVAAWNLGAEISVVPAEQRARATRTINGIKARCHAFASGEFSGVIGNLDAGDDSADALLAEMLAQIEGG